MDEHKIAFGILLVVFAIGIMVIIMSYAAVNTGDSWRLREPGNPATKCPDGYSYQQYATGVLVNICLNKGNYFCCPKI